MDKAIITVLLLIAGVTCVAFMFNGIFPAINRGSDAVVSMAAQVDDRIKSQVNIIHAVSEYDPNDAVDNWNDINGNGDFDVFGWVKNIGDSRILDVTACDVFFGGEGDFQRIPYEDYADPGIYPYWQYELEDSASEWGRGETLKISIVYADTYAASGMAQDTTYLMKLIIPNGISDEIYFSL